MNPNSKPGTIQRQVVSFMPPAAVPTWKGHPLLTEQEAKVGPLASLDPYKREKSLVPAGN